MPIDPLLAFGIAATAFLLLLVVSLCRIAAQSDRRIEERHERLTEGARVSERRRRHEMRNGMGRVGR